MNKHFDWILRNTIRRPSYNGAVPKVAGASESSVADETSGPIQLRRFSMDELKMAIYEGWHQGRAKTPHHESQVLALKEVARYRKAENRRRARAGRQNKKSELQSSNVMESQK